MEKEIKNQLTKKGDKLITGRPDKQALIMEYKRDHPAATRYRCSKDLNVDYKTVSKWWEG